MAIVNRAERKHYLNTGTEESPVWSPIGEGFTEFMESKNAVSYGRRYIHEATKRTDVTGYAPVIDYEFEVYRGNAVIEVLREITVRRWTFSRSTCSMSPARAARTARSADAIPSFPTNAERVRMRSATPAR